MNNKSFFSRVYAVVSQIPEGKVMTYGQIAACIGNPRAGRTVGWAIASSPEAADLPCHRVVNRHGKLAPDTVFGKGVQRALLEAEGVRFSENGEVDLARHLWVNP